VDRSPQAGALHPGTGIPIVPPARIATEPPDVLLVLAWNYLDEIAAQQADFIRREFGLDDGRQIRTFLSTTPTQKKFCVVSAG
jgi:hypothetical protein